MTIAVATPALAGVMLAWRTSPRNGASASSLPAWGLRAWIVVFVALGLWELMALLMQSSLVVADPAHPTISTLMDPVLAAGYRRALFLLALAGLRRLPPRTMIAIAARDVIIAGFLLLAGAIVVLQIAAVTGDRPIPTIGQVLSRIMRTRAGRIGIVAAWAWLGLHFFTR